MSCETRSCPNGRMCHCGAWQGFALAGGSGAQPGGIQSVKDPTASAEGVAREKVRELNVMLGMCLYERNSRRLVPDCWCLTLRMVLPRSSIEVDPQLAADENNQSHNEANLAHLTGWFP